MPMGSDPVWCWMALASSAERLMMRDRVAKSRTRARACQRQSFHSAAVAPGKNRRRKAWLAGLIGKASRRAGALALGAGAEGEKKAGREAGRSVRTADDP